MKEEIDKYWGKDGETQVRARLGVVVRKRGNSDEEMDIEYTEEL